MPPFRSAAASVSLAVALSAGAAASAQAQGVEIARNPTTGLVSWMSVAGGGDTVASLTGPSAAGSFEQAALDFLGGQSQSFGLRTGAAELAATRTTEDENGRGFVRVQQNYKGLPIVGAELVVQLDGAKSVMSVNGRSVSDVDVSTAAEVTAEDARRSAITAASRTHGASVLELTGSDPVLSIHDARVMGGPAAPPALVWRVDVTSEARPEIHEIVLINAKNGRVTVQFNQTAHAAPPANAKQYVCDAANSTSKIPCTGTTDVSRPASSSISDVKLAAVYAEKTYDFFAKRFGRNSLDDNGLRLISTVRYQRVAGQDYANAFWSSDLGQMVYGKDYATAEDVVGHELSHGFTSFTSNLFYYFQSGSINESMSDIFGELVQRTDDPNDGWLLGEDLPIGAIRNMKDPTQGPNGFPSQPDKMTSTLWTGDFSFQDRGGVHVNSGVGNKAAYLITDGDTFNGQTVRGLGIDKAAALFYRVNAYLLTSSSDYADLGNALNQACQDLKGTKPKTKTGSSSSSFKTSDCREVAKAVLATEMAKQPQYRAIPAEAGMCPAGLTRSTISSETFEAANSSSFKYQPTDSSRWALVDYYAASNAHSFAGYGSGQFDVSLASSGGLKLPAKAYLRFAHFYNLYAGHAGGVVEYSLNKGKWRPVPASMFLDNPYNATIGPDGALAGRPAFSGFSAGWTSSRIDLSSIAGNTVRFRFRLGTDSFGAGDAWYLDDIRIYVCNAPSASVASAAE